MNKILTILLLLLTTVCWSQRRILKMFNLKENPTLHLIDSQFVDESLVTILDYQALNSKVAQYGGQYEIATTHKIIRVQDEVGIKVANSLSIPLGNRQELLKLKVRTISPDGNITNFDIDNLVELETEKGYSIKKFAIPGVEKGGEIEYLYCIKRTLRSYGRIYYASPYPTQTLKFELFNPSIGYELKTYNGLPKSKLKRNSHIIETTKVLPLTKEGLSSYRSKVKRIDYRITRYNGQDVSVTWRSLANSIQENFSIKKGGGKVRSFLKTLELEGLSKEKKILKIENAIKNTIVFEENNYNSNSERFADPYTVISSILKTKLANTKGLFKLYLKCFQVLNIPVNLVMASSRYDGEIDEKFPHSMDLRTPMLYFDGIHKFIDPINKTMRLGVPSAEYGNSRAFKIFLTSEGIYNQYDGIFVNLPMLKFSKNNIKTLTIAELNDSKENLNINFEQTYQGYRAFNSRYFSNQMKEEDDFNSFLIGGIEDLKINTCEFENEKIEDSFDSDKPFIIKGSLESESLVENLGDDILVHIGKLIGKQSKLYKEKNRSNDVILRFPKQYDHKIEFKIPEGYLCKNLENLPQELEFQDNGKNHLFFKLTYTLVDNTLSIHLKEGYDTILIDAEKYEEYRRTVNAAADFNAFTLVLEKK